MTFTNTPQNGPGYYECKHHRSMDDREVMWFNGHSLKTRRTSEQSLDPGNYTAFYFLGNPDEAAADTELEQAAEKASGDEFLQELNLMMGSHVMSSRDTIAMAAMEGLVSNPNFQWDLTTDHTPEENLARRSYAIADAMEEYRK